MPTRREVYDVINGERRYQHSLGSDRTDGTNHTVGDFLTMINYYYRKAVDDWTNNPGDKPALHQIRKIAAICVQCMEKWGAFERE